MTPTSGRTNALSEYDGPGPPAVLTVKKIDAVRGRRSYGYAQPDETYCKIR